MREEFAETAEDVVWRRSKLGLRLSAAEIAALQAFMQGNPSVAAGPPLDLTPVAEPDP